jgi:hypothetical protein
MKYRKILFCGYLISVLLIAKYLFPEPVEFIKSTDSPIEITLHVDLEQSFEVEGMPQWEWRGSYVHTFKVAKSDIVILPNQTRFSPRIAKITEATARGTDYCRTGDPGKDWTIHWTSQLIWDSFNEPTLLILEKDNMAWILYDLGREIKIRHPGTPPCEADDGIEPNSMVYRTFFKADLEEEATPIEGYPVYVYDEDISSGGYFLTALSVEKLTSGEPINQTIQYKGDFNHLAVRLDIRTSADS